MQKMLFPVNTPIEDIRRILQDNADKVEQTEYLKPLTQEEMDVRREEMVENAVKLSDLSDQLKQIKADYKGKIEPLSLRQKEILQELRSKQARVDGTLYHIANHEDSIMETYDDSGIILSTRRLRPEEKQGTIFSTLRIASGE